MAAGDLELKLIRTNRQWSGVPVAKLKQWIAEGRVRPDDLVRPVGAERWLPVSMAPELLDDDATAPAGGAAASAPSAAGRRGPGDLGIAAPANSRRRTVRAVLEDSVMDMTPMIDVTFQLLIFFMFTQSLANPNPVEVPLAKYGRGVMPDGKQAIVIDDQGRYYLGESTKPENVADSLEALVGEVALNAQAAEQPLEVIVSAHKNSIHRPLRDLAERLGETPNIGPIRIGVDEKR